MKFVFKKILKLFETLSHPLLLVLTIILVLWLLFDLSPFGGSIRFYSKWVECDQKPVRSESVAGDRWYEYPPNFEFQRIFESQNYYCTPRDAQDAGYHPSSLN